MKNILVTVIVFISSILLFGAGDDSIPNLYQPRYLVFTAGQPTLFGMRELSEMGVKTVVNVLPDRECIPGEAAMVSANQMEYYKFPFDPSGLSMQRIYEFGELLSAVDRPVLIHCSTGNHVGGLWFAYRVLIEKASLPQALKEGRRIGMKPAMEDAVFEFIRTQTMRAAS
jgi:uncharacterized protein (TIGR01244 family)